jgi:hypothetical protein
VRNLGAVELATEVACLRGDSASPDDDPAAAAAAAAADDDDDDDADDDDEALDPDRL